MIRNSEILIVDPDPTSRATALRALRRDGQRAVGAAGREEALATFAAARPGLVISELELADGDGLGLLESLREQGAREVPVLLLSHQGAGAPGAAEARAMGAEDLFPKPLFVRDLVTFSQIHQGRPAGVRVIEGRLEKTSAAHLLRALATGSRSGRVVFLEGEGEVSFRDGRILDASFLHGCGEPALLRLLTLTRGPFHLFFEPVGGSGAMALSVDDLLRRGLPFVQRWEAIVARLPAFDTRLQIDFASLTLHLASLPDRVNDVIRLFDGERDIEAVLADSPLTDLTTLEVIDRLIDSATLTVPVSARPAPGTPDPLGTRAPEAASTELMRTLFGEGPLASRVGAEALAGQTPSGWAAGDPIAWEMLETRPAALIEVAPDTASITAWDLPAALEVAGRVAHAAAIDRSAVGSEAEALAAAADLGAIEAPDFEADACDTEDDVGLEEEAFFDSLPAEKVSTDSVVSLRWPLWLGASALTLGALAAVGLAFAPGEQAQDAISTRPLVEAVSPLPLGPVTDPVLHPEPQAVLAPKDDTWLATELAEGARAYAAGNYGDAVLAYAGAAIERRDSLDARLGLGLAYLELDDLEGASSAFRAALEIAPSSGRAIALLGSSLQIAGHRVEARRVYERYLKAHPKGPQATEIRAVLAGFDG